MIKQDLSRNFSGIVFVEEQFLEFFGKGQGISGYIESEWVLTKNNNLFIAKGFLAYNDSPESVSRVPHDVRNVQNFGYTYNV